MSGRIEVIARVSGRRYWSVEQKLTMLRDAFGPGGSVRSAMERHDVTSGSLYTWRRHAMAGMLLDRSARTLPPAIEEPIGGHFAEVIIADPVMPAPVWWRVGTFDRSSADRSMDVVTQLQRSQWGTFLRSMMVFDSAQWMNHPAATYSAETKALQIRVAQALGFDVPETAMGNDHGVLAGRPAGSRVALKSIDTLLLREGDEQIFAYTTSVEPERIAVEDLHLAPVTIQASLDPKLDLRVTVVGHRLWCAEVRGGGEPIAGDWRLTPKSDLTYSAHDLPSDIADRCLAPVSRLGLRFGAIDLALCDGRYHFIEINPTGEWGWRDRSVIGCAGKKFDGGFGREHVDRRLRQGRETDL